MADKENVWIMHGLAWDDPLRVRSWEELIDLVNELGFLPLFRNEIDGFSAEEYTSDLFWWTGDPAQDPWLWREIIAGSGKVAYGKFFAGKAGFISLEWLPYFANYRRDGYDFDARWDDGLANIRCKKIMDCLEDTDGLATLDLKRQAGFGKTGEKNFSGIVTDLQMQTYLVIRGFRRKVNKRGGEYGMPVSVYTTPEKLWGYELLSFAYGEKPEESRERIFQRVRENFPDATEEQLKKVLR